MSVPLIALTGATGFIEGIGHKLVVAPCRHAKAKSGVLLLLAGQLIDAGEIRLASLDDAVHRWPHCLLWMESEVPKLEHLHFHRFRCRKEIAAVVCYALDLSFRETVSSRHFFAKAREAAVLAERVEDFPGGMGERVNRDAVGILEEKANGYYELPARRFKFCDLHSHGNSALHCQACFYRDSWGNSIPASRNRYPWGREHQQVHKSRSANDAAGKGCFKEPTPVGRYSGYRKLAR